MMEETEVIQCESCRQYIVIIKNTCDIVCECGFPLTEC